MELIEGETLAQRLAREGRLEPDEVARIGADVATALAAAHEAGILHRDVKPANIMVDGHDRLFLMDFGLAGSVEQGDTRMTRLGAVMGKITVLAAIILFLQWRPAGLFVTRTRSLEG